MTVPLSIAKTNATVGRFGVNWRTVSEANNINNMASDGMGKMVTVGDVGTINYSTDWGNTWSCGKLNTFTSSAFTGIAWCNPYWVAVGAGGVYYSSDLANWGKASTTALVSIAGNGSIYVGSTGASVVSSTDLITWTTRISITVQDVIWSDTEFLFAGNTGTYGGIFSSTDGINWVTLNDGFNKSTMITDGTEINIYGPIASATFGTVKRSTDGVTWSNLKNNGLGYDLQGLRGGYKFGSNYLGVNYTTIGTSTDGLTWTTGTSLANQLYSCASNGSSHVAVGTGIVARSTDTITWTTKTTVTSLPTVVLNDIIYDGTRYIVVGDNDFLKSSTDGVTWSSMMPNYPLPSFTVNGYVFGGNNKFIIATGADNNVKMYSNTNGTFWTVSTTLNAYMSGGIWIGTKFIWPVSKTWTSGGSKFSSNTTVVSTDGITWTSGGVMPWAGGVVQNCISWSGSIVCAINSTIGTSAATTTDGVAWVGRTLPISQYWQCVTWGTPGFCAVGYSGSVYKGGISTDGITWTLTTTPSSIVSLKYGAGVYCGIQSNYTDGVVSTDGITWTTTTMPAGSGWYALEWNGSKFCAIPFTGNTSVCALSTDGITWTTTTMPAGIWYYIAWSGTRFCAASNNGNFALSTDGITWTFVGDFTYKNIVYTGTQYVAVGNNGKISTTTDRISWTTRTSGTTTNLQSIAYSGSLYVVSGVSIASGVLTSTDAITWTSRTVLSGGTWSTSSVYWVSSSGLFYLLTTNGTPNIASSTDGITWKTNYTSDCKYVTNITKYGTRYAATGTSSSSYMYSTCSTEGITWTSNSLYVSGASFSNSVGSLISRPNEFLKFNNNLSGTWYASLDGNGWGLQSYKKLPTATTWTKLISFGNKFFTYAGTSSVGAISSDGITWIQSILPRSNNTLVVSNSNRIILCSSYIYCSDDGINWGTYSTGFSNPTAGTWNGYIFVLILAYSAARISTDGITWTNGVTVFGSTIFTSLVWNGIIFCGVGSTNIGVTSTDGSIWTNRTLPTTGWVTMDWNGTIFCALAATTVSATSTDGITWVQRTLPVSATWSKIIWNGTIFLGVASTGTICITSTDGITWDQYTCPASFSNLAWNGTVFCALPVASSNTPYTTTDGITWEYSPTNAYTGIPLTGVYDGTKYMVGGTVGQIFNPPDNNWVRYPNTAQLNAITYG